MEGEPIDCLIFIRWNKMENKFYDLYGEPIYIFDLITPNDLYLFRHDPGYCMFPHKDNRKILCEIFTEDREECPWTIQT